MMLASSAVFPAAVHFKTIKFSGRHEDLVFSIVTVHPQHMSMKIVGQNTTLSQCRFGVFGRLGRRRNAKKGRLSSSPVERQSDLNGRRLRAVTQPELLFSFWSSKRSCFFAGELPHTRIGVNAMNEIS